ncbi:MAG TPA: LysM peptidoglycan-binding domain-containing protein [Candidatus Limnocylindrales bacterium]
MTDRGIPSTDGAAACPFVAFEDDRDARSTAPDHRHRCFAEPVPAPRAIAHQAAYCLSPAFPVCPAFQDWARREAAAARPAPASAPPPARQRDREEDTSGPVPLPPVEREPRHAPTSAAQPLPPRKVPPRDWAAPPPWMADGESDEYDDERTPGSEAPGAIAGWNAGGIAAEAAGAAGAGTALGGVAAARPWADGDRRTDARDLGRNEGRGLADSPAARLAGPDPNLPTAARPTTSWASAGAVADDDLDDEPVFPPSRHQAPLGRSSAARSAAPQPARPTPIPPRTPSARDGAKPSPIDAQELFGPAWERPRRYEAYPSLRTRVGLPSLAGFSRLGIAAAALVLAAVFLFFVAPMILGLGKHPAAQPSAGASGLASAAPTVSLAPTIAPAPTAFIYTVVSGDTLSKIAARNGVTVKAILSANPQIKNQNSIKIGDQITIPPKGAGASGAVSGASPSAVSGASPSR